LHSSVLKWPERETVLAAARRWAERQASARPEVVAIGCFGSCARGDWGVGSDLDLIAIVRQSGEPFERRGSSWSLEELPVPAEILIYTQPEWDRLVREGGRFARVLARETEWLAGTGTKTR
jgi:predicted nucleotidyltransferase